MAFSKGDKIRALKDCSGAVKGGIYTCKTSSSLEGVNCTCTNQWELVTNNNLSNFMASIKEKFNLLFVSEPEKTFLKAGIIATTDSSLTEDGKSIFLSWLLKKHGTEFKKEIVDEIIKEEEEKK